MKKSYPIMLRRFEDGRKLALESGAGLSVSTRICLEWQRKDQKNAWVFYPNTDRTIVLKAPLKTPRKVIEVVSAGTVIARFRRQYEAYSFVQGYTFYRRQHIAPTIRKLRSLRMFRPVHRMAEAA